MFIHMRLLIAVVFALGTGGIALAQTPPSATKTGQNVYMAGGEVHPSAAVGGDLAAAGGHVVVEQPVASDAALAGGSVEVRAPIGDDLRAVGGDVKVDSTVGGELFATGASVQLGPAAVVNRGARLYGSSVKLQGRVVGPLDARGQSVLVNGEVQGDATLAGDRVELGPQARIRGTLRYAARGELIKAEGAMVAGAIVRDDHLVGRDERRPTRQFEWSARVPGAWSGSPFTYLAVLACAALFMLLMPRFATRAAERVRRSPWASLSIGFAAVVAVPLLVLLLFITLLGIPLGIALLALFPVLLLAGFIVGVSCLARVLLPAMKRPMPTTFGGRIGWFALALLAVLLLARVPLVGPLVVSFFALAGLGAGVLEIHGRRGDPSAPVAPVVSATAAAPAETPMAAQPPPEPLPSPWARP